MQPLAVDASLLRAVLATDVKLAVGRELMVRVAAITAEGRGVLSLAGMMLEAELPGNVHAGEELRLQVREVTPEKVVLAIQDGPQQQTPPPPLVMAPRIPMPDGGALQVTERDPGAGRRQHAEGVHTIALRYDAPHLGPLEMRFTLTPGALALTVEVTPGAHATVDDRAGELQTALAAAAERPAKVTVTVRREPLEVYA